MKNTLVYASLWPYQEMNFFILDINMTFCNKTAPRDDIFSPLQIGLPERNIPVVDRHSICVGRFVSRRNQDFPSNQTPRSCDQACSNQY